MYDDINESNPKWAGEINWQSAGDTFLNVIESWFPAAGTKIRQLVRDLRLGGMKKDITDVEGIVQNLIKKAQDSTLLQALYAVQDEITQLKFNNSSSTNKNRATRDRIEKLHNQEKSLNKQVAVEKAQNDILLSNVEKYLSGEELLPVTRLKTEKYIVENLKK